MHDLVQLLIPIGVCVVLPVMVVWLTMRTRMNYDNKRTEVMMEAIRNNPNLDPERMNELLSGFKKKETDMQSKRLQRGCMFGLGGLVCLASAIYCGFMDGWESDGFTVLGLVGGILMAIGASYLIVYGVNRREKSDSQEHCN